MQAIQTKLIPATNTKPTRVKASCDRGSIVISYPHELSGKEIHVYVATQLVEKFLTEDRKEYGTPSDRNPWLRRRVVGQLKDGSFVHVFCR